MAILSDDPIVYDGSPVNPSGITPFGIFDVEPEFQYDAPRAAEYVARRLGYSIVDVELIDKNDHTHINKMDELGYFKFGSTIVLVFPIKDGEKISDNIKAGNVIKLGNRIL